MLASDQQIPEDKMDEFGEYVADILFEWLIEGIDDIPDSIYET